jgi:hypothetical protein
MRTIVGAGRIGVVGMLASVIAGAGAPLAAQVRSDEGATVLRVVDSVLIALQRSDSAMMRRHLLPGAVFYSVPHAGRGRATVITDSIVYRTLPRDSTPNLERIWSPRIDIFGRMAVVTAPYDFHLGGRFSHCGTDVFTLVEEQGRWRVASITYDVQRDGCAPSPLGPPPPMR